MGLLGPMFGTTFSAVVGLGLGLLGCGWGSWSQTDLHIVEAYNQIPPITSARRAERRPLDGGGCVDRRRAKPPGPVAALTS